MSPEALKSPHQKKVSMLMRKVGQLIKQKKGRGGSTPAMKREKKNGLFSSCSHSTLIDMGGGKNTDYNGDEEAVIYPIGAGFLGVVSTGTLRIPRPSCPYLKLLLRTTHHIY